MEAHTKENGFPSSVGRSKDDTSSVGSESNTQTDTTIDKRCGYFNCKPDCLQRCAKPRFLLVVMCMFAVVEAFVQWGLVNVYISTWERRYQLRSTQSAWIVTAQDVSNGVMSPIFGYLATYYHKGRMVSMGALAMCIGSFIFLIPHLAADKYIMSTGFTQDTCDLSANATALDVCTEGTDTDLDRWLVVFCMAQILFGYASCSIWTVGIVYIDENVKSEDSPLFLGIFNTFSALGATLGFILGGIFLEIYVDVGRVDMDTINIDSSDPRWVGAWWIGFALAFVLAIPSVFLMPCFPKELPAVAKLRREKKSEAYKGIGDAKTARNDFGRTCSDLGYSLKILFGNPIFILITIAGIVEVGGVSAFATFLPKIIQFQFGQTSSMAALIAGAVLVPGAAIGQLLGGIIPKAAKLRFRGIMWMLIISQIVCIVSSVGFLIRCPTPQIAGYNAEYPLNSTAVYDDPFIHSCNGDCNCTTREFAPICGQEGVAAFSPCHGGCAVEREIDGTKMYGNCTCFPNATSWDFQAESGVCPTACSNFWIFMPLLLLLILATFTNNTGGYSALMRVVPEKQRAFAFGVQAPIIRYLGNVPIPILFGLIFDLACDVWQDNCGTQGSCWIYDTGFLSIGMFVAALIIKGVSGICFIITVCIYKPPTEEIKETEEVNGKDNAAYEGNDEMVKETVVAENHTNEMHFVPDSHEHISNGYVPGDKPFPFDESHILKTTKF